MVSAGIMSKLPIRVNDRCSSVEVVMELLWEGEGKFEVPDISKQNGVLRDVVPLKDVVRERYVG